MRLEKQAQIVPPKDGWKARTFYLVEVSFSEHNPVHHAIFYTGFLNQYGEPRGYNALFNPTWGREAKEIYDVFYLKAVREILSTEDFETYPQ